MNYKVVIMYDSEYGGYVVDVPELVGCMSQGKTIDEALVNVVTSNIICTRFSHIICSNIFEAVVP